MSSINNTHMYSTIIHERVGYSFVIYLNSNLYNSQFYCPNFSKINLIKHAHQQVLTFFNQISFHFNYCNN